MSPPPDLATLRTAVSRHFRVYDAQEDKVRGQVVARRFYIMFPPGEFDARYESLRADLTRLDPALLVFLRRDGGEDILFVAERPPDKPQNIPLRVILLVATLITTTMAGAANWHGYWHGSEGLSADLGATFATLWDEGAFLWGFVSFALPLMLILGIHETAHYVAARRHGLRANLPMFIPAPFTFGTFGAFISLRDTLPDRKALFDVGVSGPLAGFFATLPVVVIGMALTNAHAFVAPDIDRPEAFLQVGPDWLPADGSVHGVSNWTVHDPPAGPAVVRVVAHPDQGGEWTYALVASFTLENGTRHHDRLDARLKDGHEGLHSLEVPAETRTAEVAVTWVTGITQFGEPLLVQALEVLWPQGSSDAIVLAHPTYIAGWVGLLITGLNLLPTGQLDGGHVARAVLGENSRHLARLALFALLFLSLVFALQVWILMALFVLLTGIYHPPPLNDRTPLDGKRKAIAWFVLAVFVLTFVPVPFSI